MPEFVQPTSRVHASFLKGMAEVQAEGRGDADDRSMVGNEIRTNSASWHRAAAFAAYTNALQAQSLEDAPRPVGYVPCTTLWWVEGDEYLGRLAIRHRLTDWLLNVGGHIGYDVRPTARKQGHATAMLRAALPRARELGIDDVLVTCDVDNVAYGKVIEANGGRFEDERDGKLRFWTLTNPAA